MYYTADQTVMETLPLTYPDGRTYSGQVTISITGLLVPHGYGKMIKPNGDTYVGYWYDGKRHGQGTCYDASNGRTYTGGFVNDEEEGWAQVSRPGAFGGQKDYLGYVYHGYRHGWGRQTETASTGETTVFEGNWFNDELSGMGSVSHTQAGSGQCYQGNYKNGRLEGAGYCTDLVTGARRQVYFSCGNVSQWY